MDYLTLAFDRPAEAWNEALPLGNGSMGAMSYGRLREEKIELNLDTQKYRCGLGFFAPEDL